MTGTSISGGIGGLGSGNGYGLNATLVANASSVRQQLDTLTEQESTGLVSQTYAGLGGSAEISLTLNTQITALQTYHGNIDQAGGSLQLTQATMTQVQKIAATFTAAIPNLNGLNPSEVDSVAANARSALTQLAGLLDTQNGSAYIFAGQDSANPPVPNPDDILNSGFYSQINAAVSSLSTNGASATAAATLAIAGSNATGTSPFSAYMSQPAAAIAPAVVQTGSATTVRTGLLASANSAAVSTGTSTTGSYMRDLMRALATLGSLSSSQVNDPGFGSLVQDTQTSLTGTVSAMATDVGIMGNTQSSLTATQTQLNDSVTALTGQVSAVQEVDMAATLSLLTSMQTQLQASYRMITSASSLSLMNYLPAG
jgi:flagellar hook-associated protein 3 FlgL